MQERSCVSKRLSVVLCFCVAAAAFGGQTPARAASRQTAAHPPYRRKQEHVPLSRALIGTWQRTGVTIFWKRGKDRVTELGPTGFEDVWVFTPDKVSFSSFAGVRSVPWRVTPDGGHILVGHALYGVRLSAGKLDLTRSDRVADYAHRFETVPTGKTAPKASRAAQPRPAYRAKRRAGHPPPAPPQPQEPQFEPQPEPQEPPQPSRPARRPSRFKRAMEETLRLLMWWRRFRRS